MIDRSALLSLLLLLAACASEPDSASSNDQPGTVAMDSLAGFRGLIGNWVDSTSGDGFIAYERWASEGDSALAGFGHVIAEGDTVFIEELRIAIRGGRAFYMVRVPDQNNGAWVHFAHEPMGADTLMFENPKHDFPQCITYVKGQEGIWNATVTGTEHGRDRLLAFSFRPH